MPKLAILICMVLIVLPMAVHGEDGSMPEVQASEILTKIQKGEPLEHNVKIIGDLNLSHTVVKYVDFRGDTFSGDANFNGAMCGYIQFNRATFSGDANFSGAMFSEYLSFNDAMFREDADFTDASFGGDAKFSGDTFSGDANFSNALFRGGYTYFNDALFSEDADFSGASFSGETTFNRAMFSRYAKFSNATFSGDANFNGAMFSRYVDFAGATFSGDAVGIPSWAGKLTDVEPATRYGTTLDDAIAWAKKSPSDEYMSTPRSEDEKYLVDIFHNDSGTYMVKLDRNGSIFCEEVAFGVRLVAVPPSRVTEKDLPASVVIKLRESVISRWVKTPSTPKPSITKDQFIKKYVELWSSIVRYYETNDTIVMKYEGAVGSNQTEQNQEVANEMRDYASSWGYSGPLPNAIAIKPRWGQMPN
jgi:uncharacterized protein YjbI with pentapeptide repeats